MKWFLIMTVIVATAGCATGRATDRSITTAIAQVGIVNHTASYIYSANVNGSGGGGMDAWGAGLANVCCTNIPRTWHPGMNVLVRWDMPEGSKHIYKEKTVEVEKYEEPGDVYMHFFPNDEVRVVVSNIAGYNQRHPILPPVPLGISRE